MDLVYKNLKKDYSVPAEYIQCYVDKFNVKNEYDYSFHRSNFMQYMRENVIDYDFFIHAALVKYKGELILIIGDKGCGKTSSILYFHKNGGEIYTDELVFFKKGKIYSIGRTPALDYMSIEKYFPEYKEYIWGEIQSKLNETLKYMLDIHLYENEKGFDYLDKIIVLIPWNIREGYLTKSEKYEIMERQFFVNEESVNLDLSQITEVKIEIMMISELGEIFYHGKY